RRRTGFHTKSAYRQLGLGHQEIRVSNRSPYRKPFPPGRSAAPRPSVPRAPSSVPGSSLGRNRPEAPPPRPANRLTTPPAFTSPTHSPNHATTTTPEHPPAGCTPQGLAPSQKPPQTS